MNECIITAEGGKQEEEKNEREGRRRREGEQRREEKQGNEGQQEERNVTNIFTGEKNFKNKIRI